MTDQNGQAIDHAKIAEELNKLAETPNPKSMTLADHIRVPEIFEAITLAKQQGHKADVIAAIMAKYGVVAKPGSLEQTYRTVRREMRGETGVKENAKPKATAKKNATARTSEAGANKPSEPKPDTGAKPAGTGNDTTAKPTAAEAARAAAKQSDKGGETATDTKQKQPEMGGVFNTSDL